MKVRKTFSIDMDAVREMIVQRHPFLKRLAGTNAFKVQMCSGKWANLPVGSDPDNGPPRIEITWEESEVEDWGPPDAKGGKP